MSKILIVLIVFSQVSTNVLSKPKFEIFELQFTGYSNKKSLIQTFAIHAGFLKIPYLKSLDNVDAGTQFEEIMKMKLHYDTGSIHSIDYKKGARSIVAKRYVKKENTYYANGFATQLTSQREVTVHAQCGSKVDVLYISLNPLAVSEKDCHVTIESNLINNLIELWDCSSDVVSILFVVALLFIVYKVNIILMLLLLWIAAIGLCFFVADQGLFTLFCACYVVITIMKQGKTVTHPNIGWKIVSILCIMLFLFIEVESFGGISKLIVIVYLFIRVTIIGSDSSFNKMILVDAIACFTLLDIILELLSYNAHYATRMSDVRQLLAITFGNGCWLEEKFVSVGDRLSPSFVNSHITSFGILGNIANFAYLTMCLVTAFPLLKNWRNPKLNICYLVIFIIITLVHPWGREESDLSVVMIVCLFVIAVVWRNSTTTSILLESVLMNDSTSIGTFAQRMIEKREIKEEKDWPEGSHTVETVECHENDVLLDDVIVMENKRQRIRKPRGFQNKRNSEMRTLKEGTLFVKRDRNIPGSVTVLEGCVFNQRGRYFSHPLITNISHFESSQVYNTKFKRIGYIDKLNGEDKLVVRLF